MGQRKAPIDERWRAAPGGERRERKARSDDRWHAATDAAFTYLRWDSSAQRLLSTASTGRTRRSEH
eukprot:1456113-Pleurochrysis_carterae.AAC.2